MGLTARAHGNSKLMCVGYQQVLEERECIRVKVETSRGSLGHKSNFAEPPGLVKRSAETRNSGQSYIYNRDSGVAVHTNRKYIAAAPVNMEGRAASPIVLPCGSIWHTAIAILFFCTCIHHLQLNPSAFAAACDYSQQKCGSVPIPYPFGIVPGSCGLPGYGIFCKENSSLGPGPMAFLADLGDVFESQLNVQYFSPGGGLLLNATLFRASSCDPDPPGVANLTIPNGAPFFVGSSNVFAAIGCESSGSLDGYAPWLPSSPWSPQGFVSGECSNPCYNANSYSFCNHYACCTLGLPQAGVQSINITGAGIAYEQFPGVCGFSTVLDPNTYENPYSLAFPGAGQWGLSLGWGIPYPDKAHNICSTVNITAAYACTTISECVDVRPDYYYACRCTKTGYSGDGYKNGTGCEDIDECTEHKDNYCVGPPLGRCTNLPGSFACSCVDGAVGNGIDPHKSTNGTGCTVNEKRVKTIIIIVGTALSTAVAVAVACCVAWWVCRIRASRARRDENFDKNGGRALMEVLSRGGDTLKVFSEGELKKATQNFAEDLQLGRGGYGTVYKGFLGDGTIVAIKRSNHMETGEAEQFINEVVILSQVNHRNIVNLLGCCLETPVPLLVYEYIPNGTLTEHLHGKDGRLLSWETRLQIALESAEALSYLHSSISTPVFHRDVKSSNILLDKTLTPKIADFGISRLLPKDQSHVSTLAHGTLGYLDPEYFQSFQLTDKSDVYSYGVVLLELITSLKPIDSERSQNEVNLPMFCLSRWKDGSFPAVIDRRMAVSEDSHVMSSINAVASLAFACLRVDGQKRPSMKSVFQKLLSIRGSVEGSTGARRDDLVLEMEDDELKALVPSSEKLSDDVTYSQKTGGSSSNPSGFEEMEMALMRSLIGGGR